MRLALLALSMTLLVSAQRPEEPYIVPLDPVIDATIDGKPVRLRVDPGSPTMPLLNPEAVARLGLRAGPQAGTGLVGSLRITGRTGAARLRLPGDRRARKTRVIWFDRPNAAGVDGEINPTLLPYQRVRFLRPGRGGVLRSLPYQDTGNRSLGTRLMLAGERVDVSFGLSRNGGSATADAGRLLAIAHGGSLAPGVQGEMEVGLGVRRPFRELRLERPIQVGPFALSRMRVRSATAAALGLSEPGEDPDEVVVTASNRAPNREIRIKADELDRCAWVEVDRRAGRITFNCPV